MSKLGTLRSRLRAFEGICPEASGMQDILTKARVMEKIAQEATVKFYSQKAEASKADLCNKLQGARLEDGKPCYHGGDNGWSKFLPKATEVIASCNPTELKFAHEGLTKVVDVYKQPLESFAASIDNSTHEGLLDLVAQANALIVTGSAVALVEQPSADKVVQHRSVQKLAMQTSDTRVKGFLHARVLAQLAKMSKLKA